MKIFQHRSVLSRQQIIGLIYGIKKTCLNLKIHWIIQNKNEFTKKIY